MKGNSNTDAIVESLLRHGLTVEQAEQLSKKTYLNGGKQWHKNQITDNHSKTSPRI